MPTTVMELVAVQLRNFDTSLIELTDMLMETAIEWDASLTIDIALEAAAESIFDVDLTIDTAVADVAAND